MGSRRSKIRRPRFVVLWALGLALGSPGVSAPALAREVVDATQAKVKLSDRPSRIVTLAPSLGELVADLVGKGGLSRVVGVSEYTDYPAELGKAASVGPYVRFNLEKVVALKPDLVLATLDGNPKDQVLHLRELGLPVVVVATSSLSDVEGSMRLVGQAVGAAAEGKAMAKRFAEGLDRIRGKKRAGEKPKVLLQIGDDPLVAVGKGAFLHDALEAVGARNLYGEAQAHYPRPSLEDVVHRDPDVILVLALGKDLKPFEAMAARWSRFAKLKAVRSRAVRVLQADPVVRPTQRLLEGLALLERSVHGRD